MSKLDEIEADLHRYARRSDPPILQDYGDLLVRAVKQLGDAYEHGPKFVSDGRYMVCSWCRQMEGRGHSNSCRRVSDPDVLELIRG